jgi:multimeric flavodoxin WrbA
MRIILHDLGEQFNDLFREKCDAVLCADGKYAPCQGCFDCWTKHPAECRMKDKLHEICRVIGQADELVIITKNLYGGYSAPVKNVLDRAIGASTPFSTYRGRQMHHTLRYGKHDLWRVLVYGDITASEQDSFRYLAERNMINHGYARFDVQFLQNTTEWEGLL